MKSNLSPKARNSVSLQRDMFAYAEREYGLSTVILAKTRDFKKSTLEDWATGETQMPLWAIGELSLPDDVSSIVLSPWKKHIGTDDPSGGDLADLECEASGVVHEIALAKRDGKVTHQERMRIIDRTRRMLPTARTVAA